MKYIDKINFTLTFIVPNKFICVCLSICIGNSSAESGFDVVKTVDW